MRPLSLYVHVPFCTRRCSYCSFYHVQSVDEHEGRFLDALEAEIADQLVNRADDVPLHTVFVGGGTPSALSDASTDRLFRALSPFIHPGATREFTVEVNPEDVTDARLRCFRERGVNRISMGIQSMHPIGQKVLKRCSPEQNRAAIASVMEHFDNVSFDVLLGVPGRVTDDLRGTIDELVGFRPGHFSVYCLEPGGDVSHEVERFLSAVDSDRSAEEYELVCDVLSTSGYVHYEVSNWARPGLHSMHNRVYWDGGDYLGLGPAAHSCVEGRRRCNPPSLGTYLAHQGAALRAHHVYDNKGDADLEALMLAMRTDVGVVADSYGAAEVAALVSLGLVTVVEGRIRSTERGFLLLNDVVSRLMDATRS